MEFAVLFVLSLMFIIYNNWLRREYDETTEVFTPQPAAKPKPKPKKVEKVVEKEEVKREIVQPKVEVKEPKIKRKIDIHQVPTVRISKDALLNSFREGKDLNNVHIYDNGRIILASDVRIK